MTIIGHCPHCGAPIWCETVWHSILPPPPIFSCSCVPHETSFTTTSTDYRIEKPEGEG